MLKLSSKPPQALLVSRSHAHSKRSTTYNAVSPQVVIRERTQQLAQTVATNSSRRRIAQQQRALFSYNTSTLFDQQKQQEQQQSDTQSQQQNALPVSPVVATAVAGATDALQKVSSAQQQQKEVKIETSEELLQRLTKKSKTAHLLQPKTMNDRLQELGEKSLDVLKKTPGFLWRVSLATGRGIWAFSQNPSVASVWWSDIAIKTKKELKHYWDGTKLLGADIAFAARTVAKLTKGNSLSRRERIQLEKTSADMFRLIPFAVIVIVPFMEFSLPILLKLFPNMLPSQFESKLAKEEELKKRIKAQLELAKFLQDTVEALAHDLQKRTDQMETIATAEELEKFVETCRRGEHVSNDDIIKFAKLFSDEITLDNISRAQLVAMCKYMGLSPFGTDAYLRMRLRNKLRKLKADDRFIYWEGVESLSLEELMFACQERGMKIGLPKNDLRKQLKEWIELSLNKNIPASLLILSRAFTYTDRVQSEEAIKMALGIMPDDVVHEVTLDSTVAESEVDININRRKLESLKRQQKLIEQEEVEHKVRVEEEKKKKLLAEAVQPVALAAGAVAPAAAATTALTTAPKEGAHEEIALYNKEEEDLKELITVMAYASSMTNERAEFDELLDKHNAVVGLSKEMKDKGGKMSQLNDRIASMLRRLDEQIDEVDLSIGTELNVLDRDRDGVISVDEVEQALELLKEKPSEETLKDIIQKLDRDGDGKISIKELVLSIKEARQREKHEESA